MSETESETSSEPTPEAITEKIVTFDLPQDLMRQVRESVSRGSASTETEFVRLAIERELDRLQRARIDAEYE